MTTGYYCAIFVWDFPHFVKAREIYLFIYLFICPRERSACRVVSICVQWAVKTGFQSAFFHSVLYGGHFSSQSLGFGELIRNFMFVS